MYLTASIVDVFDRLAPCGGHVSLGHMSLGHLSFVRVFGHLSEFLDFLGSGSSSFLAGSQYSRRAEQQARNAAEHQSTRAPDQ